MSFTVCILGARGRFGLAAVHAFADAGWRVLAHKRPGLQSAAEVVRDNRIEWLALDLYDAAALAQAARGASVVVHALNPAYTNRAWTEQALPMLDAAIALTRTLGASLMVPGNIYNFGPAMPKILREDTPQLAHTVKGQIRMALEQRLQHSGVPSVVIRAGDFFGSGKGTWFDQVIVKKISQGVFTYPGHLDVATAWAYLPDLARAFVAVAERRQQLRRFEVFHFAGYSITGQQWLAAIDPLARAQGWVKPGGSVKFKRLPWPLIRIGALLVPEWSALAEMRYLWDLPQTLDNRKLTELIGSEPHTPLALAARAALTDLGEVKAT